MKSEDILDSNIAVLTQPAQHPLFPLDPWGSEQVFAALDFPHPEIKSVMIGPLTLGDFNGTEDEPLRCLAVSRDGDLAACISLSSRQLQNQAALWTQLACEIDRAKRQLLISSGQRSGVMPADCMKTWSKPEFWLPRPQRGDPVHRAIRSFSKLLVIHQLAGASCLDDDERVRIEREAQSVVTHQIDAAIRHVIKALNPALCEIVTMRPHISVSMAHRLIALAKQHGSSAVAYALQALKTESLALLHLAASGYPEEEGTQVRDAIFSGRSLPDTLMTFGVAKATHRRTLRKFDNSAVQVRRDAGLADLPLSGADLLTVMRIIEDQPPQGTGDWEELFRLVTLLFSLDVQQPDTPSELLCWCVMHGYKKCSFRLHRLTSLALSIRSAAAGLAGINLSLDRAISLALEEVQKQQDRHPQMTINSIFDVVIDPDDLGQLVRVVSQISGQSMNQLTQRIFNVQPGIANRFQSPGTARIHALSSLDLASEHGIACGNCLRDPETTVRYVADGATLYAVKIADCVEGTIALRLYGAGEFREVRVQEVSGVNNAEPSPELSSLAQDLADFLSTEEQLKIWVTYNQACERWKQSLQ